jgi:Flp pilus assembly pilin Flp
MVEYVLLAVIVAVGMIGGLAFASGKLQNMLDSSNSNFATVSSDDAKGLMKPPRAGIASISCTSSSCTMLAVSVSGFPAATSYTYAWKYSPGGCSESGGWSSVGGDSQTVATAGSGGYQVTVRGKNSSGMSDPVTTCMDV